MPFADSFSKSIQNEIIICINVCVEICMSYWCSRLKKVSSFLSTKDTDCSTTQVLYRSVCACCSASYLGETTKHFDIRISEHFRKTSSNIFSHLDKVRIVKLHLKHLALKCLVLLLLLLINNLKRRYKYCSIHLI